jgi:hypothetical protein
MMTGNIGITWSETAELTIVEIEDLHEAARELSKAESDAVRR